VQLSQEKKRKKERTHAPLLVAELVKHLWAKGELSGNTTNEPEPHSSYESGPGESGVLSHRARYPPGTGAPTGTDFNGTTK